MYEVSRLDRTPVPKVQKIVASRVWNPGLDRRINLRMLRTSRILRVWGVCEYFVPSSFCPKTTLLVVELGQF